MIQFFVLPLLMSTGEDCDIIRCITLVYATHCQRKKKIFAKKVVTFISTYCKHVQPRLEIQTTKTTNCYRIGFVFTQPFHFVETGTNNWSGT